MVRRSLSFRVVRSQRQLPHVEVVAQTIAGEVQRHHGEEQRQDRAERDPGRVLEGAAIGADQDELAPRILQRMNSPRSPCLFSK